MSKNVYVCPVCGDKFSSVVELSAHVQEHVETEENRLNTEQAAFESYCSIVKQFQNVCDCIQDFNDTFNEDGYGLDMQTTLIGLGETAVGLEARGFDGTQDEFDKRVNEFFAKKGDEFTGQFGDMKELAKENKRVAKFELKEDDDSLSNFRNKLDKLINNSEVKTKPFPPEEPDFVYFEKNYKDIAESESIGVAIETYAKDSGINPDDEEAYSHFLQKLAVSGVTGITKLLY